MIGQAIKSKNKNKIGSQSHTIIKGKQLLYMIRYVKDYFGFE